MPGLRPVPALAALAIAAFLPPPTVAEPAAVRDCAPTTVAAMPLIAWGADGVTLLANGLDTETRDGPVARAGWQLTLHREDDMAAQIDAYRRCDSPFLRGTLGMLMAAAPLTEGDPRTAQVVIFKHSWSVGDGVVARPGLSRIDQMAGRRIAVQHGGPHVDLLSRLLRDAGLSLRDVTLVWTRDLTGEGADTPAARLLAGEADAAAMLLADARLLTEDGASPLPGARVIASTREASTVVGDYIAIRRDWFEARRAAVEDLVAALFEAEAEMRRIMADPSSPRHVAAATLMARVLLGGDRAQDGVLLWQDAVTDGLAGNRQHFGDGAEPRRFAVLSAEVGRALEDAGLLERAPTLAIAGWDYTGFATSGRLSAGPAPERDRDAVQDGSRTASAVARLHRTGRFEHVVLLALDVPYDPQTGAVRLNGETEAARETLRLAATYAGAPILIEGHADPLVYLRAARDGADPDSLRALRLSARAESRARAEQLRTALLALAEADGVGIDPARVVVDGAGIEAPAFPLPRTETEWRTNQRVRVLVLTADALKE